MVCIYHVLFVHSSVNGHCGCFCLWLLLWTTLLWMWMYKYLFKSWISVLWSLISFAESVGDSMINFWGIAIPFFTAAAPFYISVSKGSIYPQPPQLLLFSGFPPFIIAIVISVKWSLLVVLIHISLTTNSVEPLLMSLLAICVSSMEKCLCPSSFPFLFFKKCFLILTGAFYQFFLYLKSFYYYVL